MKLEELVSAYLTEQRTVGQLLDEEQVLALAVAATQFYAGYGHLDVANFKQIDEAAGYAQAIDPLSSIINAGGFLPKRFISEPGKPLPSIAFEEVSGASHVSPSDWSIIRPLFLLYCEREQALLLESGRVMGVDVFGRASSEVQQDINAAEADMPQKAFIQPVFSV